MQSKKFVSLLRGINVSGHKKIAMADLKQLYAELGFGQVVTYIQSGNVIFDSTETDPDFIRNSIEMAIRDRYGFEVPVIIRSPAELEGIIQRIPFDIDVVEQGTQLLVSFLMVEPEQSGVDKLLPYVAPPERLQVSGKEVYLHCPNGYGGSKLSNSFLEKKLGVVATTRNIKSVIRLLELSG